MANRTKDLNNNKNQQKSVDPLNDDQAKRMSRRVNEDEDPRNIEKRDDLDINNDNDDDDTDQD